MLRPLICFAFFLISFGLTLGGGGPVFGQDYRALPPAGVARIKGDDAKLIIGEIGQHDTLTASNGEDNRVLIFLLPDAVTDDDANNLPGLRVDIPPGCSPDPTEPCCYMETIWIETVEGWIDTGQPCRFPAVAQKSLSPKPVSRAVANLVSKQANVDLPFYSRVKDGRLQSYVVKCRVASSCETRSGASEMGGGLLKSAMNDAVHMDGAHNGGFRIVPVVCRQSLGNYKCDPHNRDKRYYQCNKSSASAPDGKLWQRDNCDDDEVPDNDDWTGPEGWCKCA